MVVGCDGSAPSDLALHWAAGEAAARGLPLTVCHTWEWPYREWPGELIPTELARRPGRRLLERCMASPPRRTRIFMCTLCCAGGRPLTSSSR